MDDYDLIVLIPWGIFGVAFVLLCVWLQVSSRRTRRDQPPPARRGAAATAEPADGHDATLPSQESVPGCSQDRRHQRAGAAPLDHGEHPGSTSPVVADARIPGERHPAPGPRTSATTGRVMAVVAVSAPGRPNRRPAWRG
jgi:hypothetical protein